MKRKARRIVCFSIVVVPIVYAASCGQQTPASQNDTKAKTGQVDNSNQAQVATTVSTQNTPAQEVPIGVVGTNQAPGFPSMIDVPQKSPSLATDSPSASNSIGLDDAGPDYASTLPYYCDAAFYSPNIIANNAACRPYAGAPHSYFGGLFGGPYIDYRLKHHVGRRSGYYYDDDDDGRRGYGGGWRHRRND